MSIGARNNLITTVLLALFAAEAYCVTYYKYDNEGGYLNTTILFIICGILFSVLPFWLRKPDRIRSADASSSRIALGLTIAATMAIVLYFASNAAGVFKRSPIDYIQADMIPMIRACCRRLVNGEKIYAPVMEVWNGEKPTYMTMMWASWIPCEYLTNDLRWTSVIFFTGGIALIMSAFPFRKKENFLEILVLFAIFWYYAWFISLRDDFLLSHIQEPVVVGYYLLLGYALIKNNPWLTGIAIGCCLLSRYILVFWIPVYLIYTFFFVSRRNALIMFGVVTAMELFLFILPFWIWQPKYFSDVIEYYHRSIAVHDREHALGLSALFSNDQIDWLLRAELLAAMLPSIIAFCIAYALRNKLKHLDKRLFGICSLKLTMVGFYSFVETPYHYLFFVPAIFSGAICVFALRITSAPSRVTGEPQPAAIPA